MRDDLVRADERRRELARTQARSAIDGTLARELRSDGFLDWLLAASLRELVAGASVRLRALSERYTLEVRDGGFCVVDHDNGGELRSADTLSGGETFLTSLALALELSEQVQATAGAVRLDSIFIDEGFGTLDAETLETVAAAIESLPRAGRMVGIITHVAELTERMPARIQVTKGVDGSRVEVMGAGP
jgi:exonuclease SbcC